VWLRRARLDTAQLAVLLAAGLAVASCDRSPPTGAPASSSASAPATGPASAPAGGPTSGRASGPASGLTRPAGFVDLAGVDPTILTDIRYAGPHNFVGRPLAGYREPLCLVTRQAAEALRRVQAAVRAEGKSLKMYDCYRPQRAVDDIVRWAKDPADQRMKAEFYPRVAKADLIADGYIASPTAHSGGSTVDLTLVDLPPGDQRPYAPGEPLVSCVAPATQRFPDNSIDMGTGFDCFDPLATTASSDVSGSARTNRALLSRSMAGAGFVNYPKEWWHYRLAGEPYPDTYFDFPVAR
jgi:zinc D-Ala-D-Ala dipeptidase